MKVKMLSIYSGPHGSAQPGDELIVDESMGRALMRGGFATEIIDIESQRIEAMENTMLPSAKTKKIRRNERY